MNITRGFPLKLLSNYLSSRQQYVTYNGHMSTLLPITIRVPQGFVLGLLLFLIYINDITNTSQLLNYFLFADDTTILDSDKNLSTLSSRVNLELVKLDTWFKTNKLSLNTDKTKYIIFGSKCKTKTDICIKIVNTAIERVNDIKFLGVDIDSELTWKSHIYRIQSKIASVVGVLCKIRHKITTSAALLIYDALIASHLYYCNLVWGSCYKTSLSKLFTLQKKH